jgi:hypothetical protein
MGLTVFATKAGSAIFDFNAHPETILVDNPDEVSAQGGDPFIPNPDYVEGAGFDMSEGNFMQLLGELGFGRDMREFDPETVRDWTDEYLTLKVSIEIDDYFGRRAMQLHAVASAALERGADTIVAQ